VPSFPYSCLAYLSVAVPGSTLGLLWPAIRLSVHQPLGALGLLLVAGVAASVLASVGAGRLLPRVRTGPVVAAGALLPAAALGMEAAAPSVWVFAGGMVVFGLGFGALDTALNAHAAAHFGPRRINWMHASYGLGATVGPLLVTALVTAGLGWRGVFAVLAGAQGAVAMLLTATARAWDRVPVGPAPAPDAAKTPAAAGSAPPATRVPRATQVPRAARAVLVAAFFAAVECGIESGAGIWGYVFLTAGRGLPHAAAAVAVSGYWATMFAGRAILGPVAGRFGPARVLTGGVAGVLAGAALLTVPALPVLPPAVLPVAGLVIIGLAAAPIFPLLALATAQRASPGAATWAVSLQVAASAAGSAALPAGIGLVIGTLTATAFGPSLLVLSLILAGLHGWLTRRTGRPAGDGSLKPLPWTKSGDDDAWRK
jgi:fucose permease